MQEAADEEEEGKQQAGKPRHSQGGAQTQAADALPAGLFIVVVLDKVVKKLGKLEKL